jgi:hypothetical protein
MRNRFMAAIVWQRAEAEFLRRNRERARAQRHDEAIPLD